MQALRLPLSPADATTDRARLAIAASPDPSGAARLLQRFREEQPSAYQRIAASPATLQMLVTVFAYSEFLAGEVIQDPSWIEELPARRDLHRVRATEEYEADLAAPRPQTEPLATSLARFRRRQLLRILIRDIHGFATLAEITEEVSNLADAIISHSLGQIHAELAARHGAPGDATFAVISLGKLGGRELNYSSDIDLMFLYSHNGETILDGKGLTHKEFFKKVANRLTELLSAPGPHGFSYRVDLRLRPEGAMGEVSLALEAARSYYANRARAWELQMMIKARVSAGDRALGRALLDFVEPLTYASSTDFQAIEAVSEARVRISEKATRRKFATRLRHDSGFDVKLAPGGIRDIEFLVQCLQRLHGGREPWVRHAGTLLALFRLHNKNLLSELEYGRLASAYTFLRELEHRLQVVADRQTHSLPSDPLQLEVIARRMAAHLPASSTLSEQLNAHLANVREIYERVIHAQTWHPPSAPETASVESADQTPSNLVRSLETKAPGIAQAVASAGLARGLRSFEHFLEHVLPNPEWLAWLNEDPVLVSWAANIFEHSPYFAEQLNRRPELIEALRAARLGSPPPALPPGDPASLRRYYVRTMLFIQARSICDRRPVFETLQQTSALADNVIGAAYRLAVEEIRASHPPAGLAYQPFNQMLVIALGRLGMLEFDLGSDADLLFVLPDCDASEIVFWTRVANRTIDMLMSYTGEGVIFAVDTRLRPSGREGDLVRTESAFKHYFTHDAAAWEGITYMKSRAVAGDIDYATRFLHEIQAVDWERYGLEGRSRHELRHMRRRLEEEQGAANPLKAGPGGYYDIDFILMYLRLKGAGVFFKVLNTPERIGVLQNMGHLIPDDARFLHDAAVFYRAVDHALRLSSGHAEGKLPGSPSQLKTLANLVERWTPEHLHDQPLPIELDQIQAQTRALFNKLFGFE